MFKGNSDHIVLACKDVEAVRSFYEKTVGLVPHTTSSGYITFTVGNFSLCFKEVQGLADVGSAVVHIGINFETRAEIDFYFEKIQRSDYQQKPDRIMGGPGQGPYRFYVKDPNGYTLEFESWENSSN